MQRRNSFKWFYNLAMVVTFLIMLIAGGIFFLLPGQEGPDLSAADASATSDANSYATAQVDRRATRVAAAATSDAEDLATHSARAESSATALAYMHSTATRAALATIETVPTLTAEANQRLEKQASAAATVQAVDAAAKVAFGPAAGTLAHDPNGQATCADSGSTAQDFVAEARLYNPFPADQGWDYAIAFADPSANDQSRYSIALDSLQHVSLRLDSPGYNFEDRTTTYNPLDLSTNGSNLLKVYILGDTALVYVNDKYEASFDLTGATFGDPAPRTWRVMVCTGMKEGDVHPGKSTRYDGFTVWTVP
jgi:hypothetical protein